MAVNYWSIYLPDMSENYQDVRKAKMKRCIEEEKSVLTFDTSNISTDTSYTLKDTSKTIRSTFGYEPFRFWSAIYTYSSSS